MGIEATIGPPAVTKSPEEIKVGSAQPSPQLQDKERRQRYAELRERMGRSKLEVQGETGIHYMWARKDDSEEMSRLEYLGYSKVKVDPKQPKVRAAGMRPDGTFELGDVILMQCSQEIYDFIIMDIDERSNALILNAAEEFKSQARDRGVPTFDVDKPPRGTKGR